MEYLELKDISKNYNSFNISVNLKIKKGEFFTLLGPSGCGKTTLLKIIAGFIKPDKGSLILEKKDITDFEPKDRNISIVFQNFALFPNLNVYKNISFGPESKKWKSDRIRKKVTKLLNLVNMESFSSRRIENLSGGEKQRVALARAIAVEPDILLLDEPLSALDISLRTALRKEIREIHDSTGLSTIYVTHDQEEAMTLSDRICVMNNGKAEQTGTPEEIYYNPATLFTASFLGDSNIIPYSKNIKYKKTKLLKNLNNEQKELSYCFQKENKNNFKCFFFRPEHCRIINSLEEGINKDNVFKCKIIKRSFYGSFYKIDAEYMDSRITLYDYYPFKTADSTELKFTVDSDNIIYYTV